MRARQLLGQRSIARIHRINDAGVFIPDRVANVRLHQHRPHRTANVLPMLVRRFADQRVAGCVVQSLVKVEVGIDHGSNSAAARCFTSIRDQLLGKVRLS